MSDQGAVTGTVNRRASKKTAGKVKKAAKKTISFEFESKPRPKGKKGKTWDDDWPEFLERLKALMKRYKITIRKLK